MRILVVDDHRNTLIAMSIGLRRSGHFIAIAGGADEALASMATTAFDCVVCDVRMQPVGGVELAATIRQRWPSVPVLLMTAYDLSTAERALANQLGVPCLLKPIRVDALLETMESITRGAPEARDV